MSVIIPRFETYIKEGCMLSLIGACPFIHPIPLSPFLSLFYMKYFLSTFVFALSTAGLAAAQASAGAFYITAPLEGDTWTAGTTYVVMKLRSKQTLIPLFTLFLAVKPLVRITYTQ